MVLLENHKEEYQQAEEGKGRGQQNRPSANVKIHET